MQIDPDATLRIAAYAALYLYDTDDWNGHDFGGTGDYINIEYSHSGGLSTERPHTIPGDAALLVNGTVEILADTITWEEIAAHTDYELTEMLEEFIRSKGDEPTTDYRQAIQGALYTSTSGANICSPEGTGKIIRQGDCGRTTSVKHNAGTDGSITYSIAVTSPALQNEDGSSITISCENTNITYLYNKDKHRWASDDEPEECTRVVTARAAVAGTGAVIIEIEN